MNELEPVAPELNTLPDPRDFKRMVLSRVESEIVRVRAERGEVTSAADVYDLVRGLTSVHEQLGDYATALTSVNETVRLELAEELMAIPGNEQDGTPVHGLTVPCEDGTDIKLAVQMTTKREFDKGALISVAVAEQLTTERLEQLATSAVEEAFSGEGDFPGTRLWLTETLLAFADRLQSLGSFTPQITKVERFAKDAAAAGEDGAASVVQGSVRTKKVFDKIGVKREERK